MTIVNYSVKRNTDRCKQTHNAVSSDAARHNAADEQYLRRSVGARVAGAGIDLVCSRLRANPFCNAIQNAV